jgi:hypothetical protein
MYSLIDQKRSTRMNYTEQLIGRGDITLDEAEEALKLWVASTTGGHHERRGSDPDCASSQINSTLSHFCWKRHGNIRIMLVNIHIWRCDRVIGSHQEAEEAAARVVVRKKNSKKILINIFLILMNFFFLYCVLCPYVLFLCLVSICIMCPF